MALITRRRETPGEPAERWASSGGQPLGELLVGRGTTDAKTVQQALRRQRREKRPIGELLVDGGLHEYDIVSALADQFGFNPIDLDSITPEEEALLRLDAAQARRLGTLPFLIDELGRIHCAVTNPGDQKKEEAIRDTIGQPVVLRLAGRRALERALDRHYQLFHRVENAVSQAAVERAEVAQRQPTTIELDAPVVQIVDLLLTQGLRDRASDIHLEPQADRLRVRYRVDGALHDVQSLPMNLAPSISSRLKIMAGMDIVDRHRAQDGQIAMRLDGRPIDIRVATMETTWGEKVVLRLLDPSRVLVSMKSLGLEPEVETTLRSMIDAPYGLIVVTGPTGSGKTTTLYSILNELDSKRLNITTIEDPVEYQFADISQVRINKLADMTFANGLRAILRQDPDVILVGEVRDAETASIAIQAALTGHLVLCSLHASDTAGAVHRFLDMGIEAFLVASALAGVLAQRLIRTNCERCAAPYQPRADEVEFYRETRERDPDFITRTGRGCARCAHTGFYGRTGVFELLRVDDDFRQLIVDRATSVALRTAATSRGTESLQEAACKLVEGGTTSLSEAMRAVYVI